MAISHTPERPENVSDELYELGYLGASNSNLSAGIDTLAESIIDYMDDNGVNSVGHRSWLFTPGLKEIGLDIATKLYPYTEVTGGTNYTDVTTSAAHVNNASTVHNIPYEPILWPAKTVMPIELMSPLTYYSISLDPNKYRISNEANLKIRFTINGEVHYLTATGESPKIRLETKSYGHQPQVVVFVPGLSYSIALGDAINIRLTGIQTVSGKPTSFEYDTKFFSFSE